MAHTTADPTSGVAATRLRTGPGASGGSGGSGRATDEPTLGALLASASRDLTGLVHSEIELAKTELKVEVSTAVKGGAMFGAAAVLGGLALLLLSHAAAWGLFALGLPAWVGFVIVAVVYLLLAGVFALIGKRAVSKVGPPERTVRTAKDTAAFLKSPLNGQPG
jgi:hypothetical protein